MTTPMFGQCPDGECDVKDPGANDLIIEMNQTVCITKDANYFRITQRENSKLIICDADLSVFFGVTGFVNVEIRGTGTLSSSLPIGPGVIQTPDCANDGTLKVGFPFPQPVDPADYGCIALPVELISFTGEQGINNKIELFWTTATELNNDFFVVQRSVDLKSWVSVDTVLGSGTINEEVHYTSTDFDPSINNNYYRLMQHDYDGKKNESNIIFVSYTPDQKSVLIYPNPTKNSVTLEPESGQIEQVSIYNSFGEVVSNQEIEPSHQVTIDLTNYPKGVYVINLYYKVKISSHKLIKE